MGSLKRDVSLLGSSVKGTWKGAPVLGALKVMKGRLWGWTGAQLGNLSGVHLLGTSGCGREDLCWRSVPLSGSSEKGTWGGGFPAGDP
jgi:hypothetical protein